MTLTLLNVSLKTRKSISKISGNFQNILALKIFFEKKNSVSLVSATRTNLQLNFKFKFAGKKTAALSNAENSKQLWRFHAEIG